MVLVPIGSVITVSPEDSGTNLSSSVFMNAVGDFIVSFSTFETGQPSGTGRAVLFDQNGDVQKRISLPGVNTDAAISPLGNIILASSYEKRGTNVVSISNSYPNGGTTIARDTDTSWNAALPEISMNADGSYFLVWNGTLSNSNERDIYFQAFNAKGELIEPLDPILVNGGYTQGFQGDAQVESGKDDKPIIVWFGEGRGDQQGVYARFGGASQFLVNTTTEGSQSSPAIASNSSGQTVIAWQSSVPGQGVKIFGQRFNSEGEKQGQEFQISETGNSYEPEVVMDAAGNFTVSWSSNQDIYARQFQADGTPKTDAFIVNPETEGRQGSPDIAIDAQGDMVIMWRSQRKERGGNDILARRYEARSEVVFDSSNYQVDEGGESLSLQVKRLDETQLQTEVMVNVSGGTATAGEDYQFPNPVKLTFSPGETSKTIEIPIVQDKQYEGNETISLSLSADTRAFVDGANASATIGIIDDDPPPTIKGSKKNDKLTGTNADEILIGLEGNDTIQGKGGRDTLYGVSYKPSGGGSAKNVRLGKGEIDVLQGGKEGDRFMLGDKATVYYNDGIRKNSGLKDYALIKDFKAGEGEDVIKLYGKPANYSLGASPKGMPKGVALYLETGKVDELIAIVKGEKALDLNSIGFDFSKTLT